MESASTCEYKALTDELAQGMEEAMQLRLHLCSASPSGTEELLLRRIISTFEKALYTLKWGGHVGQAQVGATSSAALESSVSVDGSPRNDDVNENSRDHFDYVDTSKKRKLQPTWTEQVKVNSEIGLEGSTDDGYNWRKYGQKDILGAKHPRSYYRCTYRASRNCWATKHVQRSDDDPTIFDITYKGTHTCSSSNRAVPPPASPDTEKQQMKHGNPHNHRLDQQNQTLLDFKADLRVNTDDLDTQEMPAYSFPSAFACHDMGKHSSTVSAIADDNQLGTYPPFFYSPVTSESSYFSATTNQISNCGGSTMQHSESDIADMIPAHASTYNSLIEGMEFSIYPDFTFNMPGFSHN